MTFKAVNGYEPALTGGTWMGLKSPVTLFSLSHNRYETGHKKLTTSDNEVKQYRGL